MLVHHGDSTMTAYFAGQCPICSTLGSSIIHGGKGRRKCQDRRWARSWKKKAHLADWDAALAEARQEGSCEGYTQRIQELENIVGNLRDKLEPHAGLYT